MAKIKYTSKGQPYVITASGRARFIKKKSKVYLKTGGRKKMARRRRAYSKKSYSKKSSSFLGLNANTIWQGVGAGAGGAVGGLLNQFVPQLGSNLAQGAAGIALSYVGKGPIKQMGKGMVISTIGQLVEENVMPMVLGSTGIATNSVNWWQ